MRRAMEQAQREGVIVAAHCEVNELLRGGYIHDGEYARMRGHRGISSESEYLQIEARSENRGGNGREISRLPYFCERERLAHPARRRRGA